MKKGWLIVNGYLKSKKFDEIYAWLLKAAEEAGCELRILENDRLDSILPADSSKVNWREKPDYNVHCVVCAVRDCRVCNLQP